MKILVYADIHGNKYALEQLQKLSDYKQADLRIFLGDVFAMCPYSKECFETLLKNNDILIMGNHDSYGAFGLPVEEWPYFNEIKVAHQKYMREKLGKELQAKLAKLPKNYRLKINDIEFYFTHYAWENDKFVKDDPDEPFAPSKNTAKLFSDINADYIIFAHNHQPSDFVDDKKKFVCVGSLGMKRVGNYVLIKIENNQVVVKHKKINCDIEKLIKEMREENYPAAENYIKWFDDVDWSKKKQI